MKFLGLVVPSGILFCWGPEVGSAHDSGIANKIGLADQIAARFGEFRVFADQGFPLTSNVLTPFRTDDPLDMQFNNQMNSGRIV